MYYLVDLKEQKTEVFKANWTCYTTASASRSIAPCGGLLTKSSIG